MSGEYLEPMFETLAEWVEAGGDPDFALQRVGPDPGPETLPRMPLLQTGPYKH